MLQNEEYQDSFLKMSFQVSKMVGSGVITVPDPITKLAKWQQMCIKFEKQTYKSFQIEVCKLKR